MNSETSEMACVVCGNASALMCQRCGESYCNDVCQRKDWQRHKYFCIIMPPLVSSKPLKPAATAKHDSGGIVTPRPLETESSKCSLEDLSGDVEGGNNNCSTKELPVAQKQAIKLSTEWRNHVNPPENGFFDCRVTYVDKDDSFWVVEESNSERLERLADNMARSMQNKKPCYFQEIAIGDLVCVVFDQKMYRAEVMSMKTNAECEVRLIDYGAVASFEAKNVYLAVPRMAEIKAYAFRVKTSSKEEMEINKVLSLRLSGSKTADGIYQVQLNVNKTIPLDLPIQVLSSNPDIILVKTFKHNVSLKEPQVALLQVKGPSNLNEELNSTLSNKTDMKLIEPIPEQLRTFFIAALTEKGYRRAFLIDFIEQPSKFLVYEMDEGRISIADEVRRIPEELLDHPQRVFAVTLTNDTTSSLQQLLSKCGRELSIKFQEENTKRLRTAQATLLAQNQQVCAVRADTFMGRVADLGLKLWQEPIENGSLVYITHIVNYNTICISSVQSKLYPSVFKSLVSKCQPFDPSSEIPIGTIVLVVCPNGKCYRAKVVADMESSRYGVRNIDTGTAHRVPPSYLHKSCAFLENLPVSQCRVNISTICSVSTKVLPSNISARILQELYDAESELEVKFTDSDCSSLDLLGIKAENSSLVFRMLDIIFDDKPAEELPKGPQHVPEEIKATQPGTLSISGLPPSPPKTPIVEEKSKKQINRHYFDDIKRELLPLGNNVQILTLNAIGLHKTGYITACFFSSEKVAENFQNLLTSVAEIGNDDQILPGYLPDVGEMCLTLFSEDNTWYRGVCLKVRGQDVEILYCDFGNSEVVPLKNIKPIPTELLKSVYATKCFIDGFDKSKNFLNLEEYLKAENNIACTVLEGSEPNTRLVKIPKLDKILSKELK
ncbi:uncharacterized protein LOC117791452 [Drosophila innubila]|uniref:uncharacterized protein LOC117791452 n=1 Tax=Drosophila innubila TaxID=198719 RepID=UPI00148BDA97|nr:uncharacterized protein LOC117791452 [Drosophila innubila]